MAAARHGAPDYSRSEQLMAINEVPPRRVRVWFGRNPIFDYLAEPELAQRYEDAMRRRCSGLRVTNEPNANSADKAGS
jgi:hypothetical protein